MRGSITTGLRALALCALGLSAVAAGAQPLAGGAEPGGVAFREVWAYLMRGEERFLGAGLPITDLCLFSAEINAYGELVGVPPAASVSSFPGRKHLVVAEIGSYSLTHFCLDPAFPIRAALVDAIVAAAEPFDGVQIDFEAIPVRDRDNFVTFLGQLKAGLGPRILSVAVPARLSAAGDALGYARLAAVADRIVVMAYDEHWSTSEPGPVASMDWCRSVAAYARSVVPVDRLVMGLPFYGRAWGDRRTNRALKYSAVEELIAEKGIGVFFRESGIPRVRYQETVNVDVYYDDAESLLERMRLYRDSGVRAVAFWRLGQEDPAVWKGVGRD